MRFLVAVILGMLLGFLPYAFNQFVPWWLVVFAGLLPAAMIQLGKWRSFLAGFLAIFLLWLAICFWIDHQNEGLLSARMASVLPANGSPVLLMFISALVGGLIGGLGGLIGSFLTKTKRTGETIAMAE